ncbi:MAG: hypothetical protein IPI58_03370 [Alphaproteobacteria bacterium]|nr:MAG: hypothetical protein IPI58_03370 [Alphaproteobacteria bacterium]
MQKRSIAALPAENRHFMVQRSPGELIALLAGQGGAMLGCWMGPNLAAQIILRWPKDSFAGTGIARPLPWLPHEITMLQGALVDPLCRQRGITRHLLLSACGLSVRHGRMQMLARIAAANTPSLRSFLSVGFGILACEPHDPSGRETLYLGLDLANHRHGLT